MTETMTETIQPENDEVRGELPKPLAIKDIMGFLPHRYPFLLVDRVTEHTVGESIKGYKNVTMNEPFFQGHFPGEPIMPGVLQLEAMAQLGGVLLKHMPGTEDKLMVFAGIDKARFRKIVVPGDRLDMECVIIKFRPPFGKSSCKAYVNGELVVEAEMMFSLIDRKDAVL